MDAQVPLGYCKRERGSRFPHTPTHILSLPGATNQRSATQNMNCLQHVIFKIYNGKLELVSIQNRPLIGRHEMVLTKPPAVRQER
jgi:hypothetical protein